MLHQASVSRPSICTEQIRSLTHTHTHIHSHWQIVTNKCIRQQQHQRLVKFLHENKQISICLSYIDIDTYIHTYVQPHNRLSMPAGTFYLTQEKSEKKTNVLHASIKGQTRRGQQYSAATHLLFNFKLHTHTHTHIYSYKRL